MARHKRRGRQNSYGGVKENVVMGGVALLVAGAAAYFFVLPQIRESNLLKYASDTRTVETPNGRYVISAMRKFVFDVKTGKQLSENVPAELAEIVYIMKKYNVDLD